MYRSSLVKKSSGMRRTIKFQEVQRVYKHQFQSSLSIPKPTTYAPHILDQALCKSTLYRFTPSVIRMSVFFKIYIIMVDVYNEMLSWFDIQGRPLVPSRLSSVELAAGAKDFASSYCTSTTYIQHDRARVLHQRGNEARWRERCSAYRRQSCFEGQA